MNQKLNISIIGALRHILKSSYYFTDFHLRSSLSLWYFGKTTYEERHNGYIKGTFIPILSVDLVIAWIILERLLNWAYSSYDAYKQKTKSHIKQKFWSITVFFRGHPPFCRHLFKINIKSVTFWKILNRNEKILSFIILLEI